jgi:hypothetical protein
MYDNCFDKDGNPNYLKMGIYMLITPKYLTNLSIILFILAYIIKNKFFIYSLLPLLISNTIFIVYYILKHFRDYDRDLIYKICGEDNPKKEEIYNTINDFPLVYFNIFNFIIHFWHIALILYKVKTKSALVDEIKNSNFIASIFITLIIVGIWTLSAKKNTYILIGIDETKLEYYVPRYLLLHFIVTYMYFNSL